MTNTPFQIKPMSLADLQLASSWAAHEGWNPGLNDAACYYQADGNGFLMGWLGDEPIACISVVKYPNQFAFLGFYIVKPEYRGLGYGWAIWQAGMQYLAGCNVGLDGVVAQQANYQKSGFALAYNNIRYQAQATGQAAPWPSELGHLVDAAELSVADIANYDAAFFPARRDNFLRAWLSQPQSTALAVTHQGAVQGYGVLRRCQQGYKIGPLYANNPQLAEGLFLQLLARVEHGEPVFLDVPDCNAEALALAERQQLQPVFATARMYTGPFPALPFDRLFGVTSFEIG